MILLTLILLIIAMLSLCIYFDFDRVIPVLITVFIAFTSSWKTVEIIIYLYRQLNGFLAVYGDH